MSNVLIEKQKIDLLANAISDKSGVPVTMTLGEMIEAVDSIEANPAPTLQAKTYTVDSAGTETITADSGYDGLSSVMVSVPSASPYSSFANPHFFTENSSRKWNITPTTVVDVGEGDAEGWLADGFSQSGNVYEVNAVPSGTSVTPTESAQTIGGANYMMEGAVTVNAIPSYYVGSGIPHLDSGDLVASGQSIIVPAGYYEDGGSAMVSSGTATPASTISATGASVSTGTNTLTLSKSVSNTPQVSAGYVSSGTAGNSSVSLTASVTTQAAQTIYPSTSDQTIAASRYLTGAQTIKAVTTSNLTAENIKSGVTVTVGDSADADRVASVTGTYTGGGGGGIGTLLTTYSMGTISTSSTQAADTGKSVSVSGVNNYDLLIVETSVDTVTNNRHTATVGLIFLTASSTVETKNGASVATVKWNSRISSSAVTTTRAGTTAYGIYPNSCSVATSNNVTTATISMYQRYNSTSTGTINGNYTTRVYGVNLYDLIGG